MHVYDTKQFKVKKKNLPLNVIKVAENEHACPVDGGHRNRFYPCLIRYSSSVHVCLYRVYFRRVDWSINLCLDQSETR